MSTTVPISQLPNGVVPTIAALRALSVVTMSDGDYVRLLGSGTANDGFQGSYFFSGACTLGDNTNTIITTSTTGAWIRSVPTVTVATSQTVSYSGVGETLVLLSGAGTKIIYTLPPSYTMFGQEIKVKSLGTGQVEIRATGSDTIFPVNSLTAGANIIFQSSGATYGLRPYNGVYYQL